MVESRTGRCRCGAVSYVAEGAPAHHALCHCNDCRRSAGTPMVGWIAYPAERVRISGDPVTYESSPGVERRFCGRCGTGLFYLNEAVLPGVIDIQSGTLDDAGAVPPEAHIQTSERLGWMTGLDAVPAFERYPGM